MSNSKLRPECCEEAPLSLREREMSQKSIETKCEPGTGHGACGVRQGAVSISEVLSEKVTFEQRLKGIRKETL